MNYLLAALAGGFFFLNSQATPNKVAGRIESVLRQQYPGARVDVDVKGSRGLKTLKGNFREVHLSMSNFRTVAANGQPAQTQAQIAMQSAPVNPNPKKGRVGRATVQLRNFDFNGIQVELAELEMGDVIYDLDAIKKSQLQIISVGPGRAHLVVPASSLQALVKERVKDIKNARISLQNGQLRLTGTRAAPIIGDLPFSLTARPEVRNGSEIWLADAVVTLGGQALPGALTQNIVGPMNPIFSFFNSKMPFRVLLRNLTARNDKLELGGDVSFPALGATAKPPVTAPQTTAPSVAPQTTVPMSAPLTMPN